MALYILFYAIMRVFPVCIDFMSHFGIYSRKQLKNRGSGTICLDYEKEYLLR